MPVDEKIDRVMDYFSGPSILHAESPPTLEEIVDVVMLTADNAQLTERFLRRIRGAKTHPSVDQYRKVVATLMNPSSTAADFNVVREDIKAVVNVDVVSYRIQAMVDAAVRGNKSEIMFLGDNGADSGGINMVDESEEWEEFVAIMDSGAVDSVTPLATAVAVPLRESKGSKAGQQYFTANGARIANQGEKLINAFTNDMEPVRMLYQVADVTKPLCSVGRVCDHNNLVCFSKEGGFVYHKATGHKTPFQRENGVYVLKTWIPPSHTSPAGFARQG